MGRIAEYTLDSKILFTTRANIILNSGKITRKGHHGHTTFFVEHNRFSLRINYFRHFQMAQIPKDLYEFSLCTTSLVLQSLCRPTLYMYTRDMMTVDREYSFLITVDREYSVKCRSTDPISHETIHNNNYVQ